MAGAASLYSARGTHGRHWLHFFVYLLAILLSSGMKVAMPKTNGTMSVNFPFVLLGIVQLSPLQVIALAVASVIAQCRIKVVKPFTVVQMIFNVANVTTATVLACLIYTKSLHVVRGEVAPALTIAATAYFLANTVPLALVLSCESESSPFKLWGQEFPWYYPFYVVGAILAFLADFVGTHFGWMTSLLIIPMVYTVYRAYRAQMAIISDREQHIVEIEALHLRTIEGLAMAIEAKDQNTHEHLMRVRVYVSELGRIMGLDSLQMKALATAASLHDIGKLAVPEHIINKPGRLTPEEFEKMKIHPVVGADILERVRFPYPVVPIVRSHHEAWDGSGYPDGLEGEEIPIGARILSAVDCFDALASDRPYRRALPVEEALAYLKSKAGVQFDPEVVRLLEEHYPELEERAHQEFEQMMPLDTDLVIEHGAAPSAGFEQERVAPPRSPILQFNSLRLAATSDQRSREIAKYKQALAASRSLREASRAVAEILESLIPFDCFAVYLRSEASIVAIDIEGPCSGAFSPQRIPVGEGLSGWVAKNARSILNGNPTVEPNILIEAGLFTSRSSALSAPVFSASGDVLGAVTLYSREQSAYSKDHLRVLEEIAREFAWAVQNMPQETALEGIFSDAPAASILEVEHAS
ncbi:MAG TPA: HD domain-containing phosphohydrolase [Candidatus Aquilonibacter sp.]|nr:HD domain-containing phosphohydrolase [Candidatus Aquilonibacter sp.]